MKKHFPLYRLLWISALRSSTLIILISCCLRTGMHAQDDLGIYLKNGYSLNGNSNLIPTTWQHGAAISIGTTVTGRFRCLGSFETSRITTKSGSIDRLSNYQFGFHCGYTFNKENPGQWLVCAGVLYGTFRLSADPETFPDGMAPVADSRWRQWGYQTSACYYFNRTVGLSASISHSLAGRYERHNSQAFFSVGVVFRHLSNTDHNARTPRPQ